MKIGKTSQLINHLFGVNNTTRETLKIDGLNVEWRKRIKNNVKNKRKHTLRLSRI